MQFLNNQNALNTKKLDILFARKADAYKTVLERAIEFGADPKMQEKYMTLQNSIHGALIVASREVVDVLDGDPRTSLHMNANRLRLADDEQEIERYRAHEWRETLERADDHAIGYSKPCLRIPGGSRPRIRDDVAQHSDLMSPGVPR